MLAYATHQRSRRRLRPSTLALIVGGHAVAIGLLISAKMTIDVPEPPTRTSIYEVPLTPPPEPVEPQPRTQPETRLPPPPDSRIDLPPRVVPTPQPPLIIDSGPAINSSVPDIGPALGNSLPPILLPSPPPAAVVRIAARAATPAELLRPPYPESKRRSEEEAVLRLHLSIDARGRVTGVEPLGAADPDFLAAARAHLVRHWRYRPATEDGRAVSSTLNVTLRFELEE